MAELLLKIITVLGTFCSVGYYILCLWGARRFLHQRKTFAPMTFAPPVSILKPLSGADPQAYENFRSHCLQDYPEFEIIFGVSDPKDAAIPMVQRLIKEFPDQSIRLVICPKILGANLKVSNLIQMLAAAGYQYVLVNDGDIRVGTDYLRGVMTPFVNSQVGMVTCLYRGIGEHTIGSRMEAMTNLGFAGGVLTALQVEGGMHFGLGSTLAVTRHALSASGGFEALVDYLADDFELGRRVAAAGFQVVLSDAVVDHWLPDYSFADFVRHQLRWARSTRASRPRGYAGVVLTFGLPWAVLAVLAAGGARWSWLLLVAMLGIRLTVGLVLGFCVLKQRRLLRDLWLIPVSDFLALAVWIGSYTSRRVFWRGNQFVVEDGKLRPA
ncbi:MAG: bacteriohopanetetrol glucosamine biosynthesis glycosyltransferase HpnI [Acidobacteria bacterium]|nr:bacteriohopanetetrol glucosamine biosynthesis glycosyltransferase HpnI [Acidobacteriota bacterium]